MAAIIHPPHHSIPGLAPERPPRPHLVVIEGGAVAALRRRQPAAVYRRRRLVVTGALLIVLLLALGLTGVVGAQGSTPAAAPTPAATASSVVIVQPGDTLWSIARRAQPEGDVRSLVDELAAANGGASVRVGQRVVVPAG